ncbi:MAG: adenosylhomocysteinase [Egibacteraceae bacterium]
MERFERARLDRYFTCVIDGLGVGQPLAVFVVTHLLPERPAFLRAAARVADVRAVLPKPKSLDGEARREIEGWLSCDELSRDRFADPETAVAYLEQRANGERVAFLDVGGYLAPSLRAVCSAFSGEIVGVVEDTENGLRRYLDRGKPPCPVFSVARSPLKEPEDYLVGQSVVFSTEALIRSRGGILQGGAACVIGFGKLGSSIARTLHAKHVRVTVYDRDPVRMIHAFSQGFRTASTLREALEDAGVVMCATGNLSLRGDDFTRLRNGAYVASVTSSEDELDLDALDELYERTPAGEHVTRYSTTGHFFYVLNRGNAVNFLHGACVGAFIHLVQAEILAATAQLTRNDLEPGFHEVDAQTRRRVAATWLDCFAR